MPTCLKLFGLSLGIFAFFASFFGTPLAPLNRVASAAETDGAEIQQFFFAPLNSPPVSPPPVRSSPTPVDFRITNIEITQAVQCLDQTEGDIEAFCKSDNQIPLVVGKPTLIRVYVRNGIPTGTILANVQVQLAIVDPSIPFIPSRQDAKVFVKDNPERRLINDTANFTFLCQPETCRNHILFVRAEVTALEGSVDTNPSDNTFPAGGGFVEVPFVDRRPLFIEYRSVGLVPHAAPPGTEPILPEASDLRNQHSYLQDAFPVPGVSYREAPRILYGLPEEGFIFQYKDALEIIKHINTELALVPPCALCLPPDEIVAWLSRRVFGNGIADTSYDGMGVATVIDSMFTYGILGSPTLAHEIGHNLGRRHPTDEIVGCPKLDDKNWPYRDADNADFRSRETGVRQLPVVASILTSLPGSLFDFMIGHHCRGFTSNLDDLINGTRPDGKFDPDPTKNGNWISPYTYHQLFCAQSLDSAESSESVQGNASPLGECRPKAGIPIRISGPVLLVSGTLRPDGTGAIQSIYRIVEPGRLPQHEPGPFCVNLEMPGLTVPIILSQQCFDVSFIPRGETVPFPPGTPPQPAVFLVALPWVDGGTQLVLQRNGQILDVIPLSPNPPQVGTVTLVDQMLQWQASDPDGDPLAFAVLYSPDGDRPPNERRFIPLAVDLANEAFEVDLDKLPGGTQGFFRVFARDDRGQTSIADSAAFVVPKKPPRVSILSPAQGSQFLVGDAIVLRGNFDDLEDVQLPPQAFHWASDRDGPLALGQTIGTNTLSAGHHVITLTVTDSDSLTGQAQVELIIRLPCDIDGNNRVDRNDIGAIFAARNTPAGLGDPGDANGDGRITVEDARICTLQCTNPRCAP